MLVQALGACALAAWLAVLLLPSRPYGTRERLEPSEPDSDSDSDPDLGDVAVLIPARNEAAAIGMTLEALGRQGQDLKIVVVDDRSDDATADVVRAEGERLALDLTLVEGKPLPQGWGGKLWALQQGLDSVARDYCLLLDAEIVLAPGMIAALRDKARDEGRAIVSIMARLKAEGFWERLLAPPFVFFFKLIYPFARVNDPRDRAAGAAGGCLMIETRVLRELGGFDAIKDAMIDDCSLAALVKRAGHSIWLGLSASVVSLRRYRSLASFRRMVTRTAFTQLGYSTLLLVLVCVLMLIVFVAPIASLVFAGEAWGRAAAAGALLGMGLAYWPTVAFYRLPAVWLVSLPLAAALFLAMTVESAFNYWRGVRAVWKGRAYRRP
ncbi:MAG TPA: glycosyltransferase [Gammaproteobacteria bacterium]|jgi:hopene-associated glycosyltransferase HpnB